MGISNLSRLCAAVLFATSLAPAFAADPPTPRGNVSVNLNPTTSYYSVSNSTIRLPSGVSVSPSSASLPVVTKYPAGLQQSIPTGITIDAIKKSAPLSASVRAKTQSVKNAAKTFLGSPRSNLAFLAAGAGLQALLDGVDWVMTEGSGVRFIDKYEPNDIYNGIPEGYSFSVIANQYTLWQIGGGCSSLPDTMACVEARRSSTGELNGFAVCNTVMNQSPLMGYSNLTCYYGGSGYNNPPQPVPVPADIIDSTVDSNYIPDPTDWRSLSPDLEIDDVEITWAPTLEGEPKTTTVYDADGNPRKITETNIWYDFDIRDNPSPQPKLDLKKREETKTYENGVLTGTTITNSTDSAGSGGTPPPPPEIPTDCDFMPTVCAFIDWFKDDNLGDDPDLRSIMKDDEDFARSKTINFGAAVCPAPHTIHIPSLSMSVDLSFEFFCQFAEYARALVLAAAYIIAAYISLGVARA